MMRYYDDDDDDDDGDLYQFFLVWLLCRQFAVCSVFFIFVKNSRSE